MAALLVCAVFLFLGLPGRLYGLWTALLYVGWSCHTARCLSHQSDSLLFGSRAAAWLLELSGKELR